MTFNRLFQLSFVLAILSFAVSCAVNPVTGKSELSLLDETQEVSLGTNQYGPTQQSQGGPYTRDRALTDYVQRIGNTLAKVSDRNLPYEFVVIDDSTPNAWALPGGKIGINRGLLVRLNSEAELAAVLSHEIVHAAARHSAKSIERGLFVEGVLSVAGAALESGNSSYSGVVQDGARLGSQILLQSYGREAELESDAYGMVYMVRAGYDPEAAVTLQETFVALSAGRSSDWVSGLFASHPPSEERVARNRDRAKRLNPEGRALSLGFEAYQAALAPLSKQSKAYERLDQANQRFREDAMSEAKALAEQALELAPSLPKAHSLLGDIAFKAKRWDAAIEHYSEAIKAGGTPGYFKDYLGRGIAHQSLKRWSEAEADLNESMALLPTEAAKSALAAIENSRR